MVSNLRGIQFPRHALLSDVSERSLRTGKSDPAMPRIGRTRHGGIELALRTIYLDSDRRVDLRTCALIQFLVLADSVGTLLRGESIERTPLLDCSRRTIVTVSAVRGLQHLPLLLVHGFRDTPIRRALHRDTCGVVPRCRRQSLRFDSCT